MLHAISLVLLLLVGWFLLGLVAVLVLGVWLRRAGAAPTGPATQRVRAPVRGAARLAVLPYIIESSARQQQRRRHV